MKLVELRQEFPGDGGQEKADRRGYNYLWRRFGPGKFRRKPWNRKKVSGLYFAGEVIDVDACTGGFNLQIAFSTAYASAMAAVGTVF